MCVNRSPRYPLYCALLLVLGMQLAACSSAAKEVSRNPQTPGVSVQFNAELKSAAALAGQLSVDLFLDGGEAVAMALTSG